MRTLIIGYAQVHHRDLYSHLYAFVNYSLNLHIMQGVGSMLAFRGSQFVTLVR